MSTERAADVPGGHAFSVRYQYSKDHADAGREVRDTNDLSARQRKAPRSTLRKSHTRGERAVRQGANALICDPHNHIGRG